MTINDVLSSSETLSLVANLSALTILGFLYIAYIKNLKSSLALKDEQSKALENRIAFLREKNIELERKTPEFVEKVLSDRIRVREDELQRLSEDADSSQQRVRVKEIEISSLQTELNAAKVFGRSLEIYDGSSKEMRTLNPSELELVNLGSIWVDSATIFIGDPYHFQISREHELEEYPLLENAKWFRDIKTGEMNFTAADGEMFWDEYRMDTVSLNQLVGDVRVEFISAPDGFPADPATYIKGETMAHTIGPDKCTTATFFNGVSGAGISIGIGADGSYNVRAEKYDGRIVRLMIDV